MSAPTTWPTTTEMLREIDRLRAERAWAALGVIERRWIARRALVVPLFALGMVTHEVAAHLGLTAGQVAQWSRRDAEIGWWCQAAAEARREVRSTGLTQQELTRRHNRKTKARLHALTAANGGIAPVAEHGKVGVYGNWGCRCEPCTAAHSAACRDYKARRR